MMQKTPRVSYHRNSNHAHKISWQLTSYVFHFLPFTFPFPSPLLLLYLFLHYYDLFCCVLSFVLLSKREYIIIMTIITLIINQSLLHFLWFLCKSLKSSLGFLLISLSDRFHVPFLGIFKIPQEFRINLRINKRLQ